MLFNKDWDKKPYVPSLDDFIGWLETKNPTETYNYQDRTGRCCLGQYMADRNIEWSYPSAYDCVSRAMRQAGDSFTLQRILAGDGNIGYEHDTVMIRFGSTLARAKAYQHKRRMHDAV